MIIIEMGNTTTLVPIQKPEGTVYETMEGEQVLQLRVPDDVMPREALLDITTAVAHHMDSVDGVIRPAWIECSNADLLALLVSHYGLTKKQTARPKRWGQTKTGEPA